jgi:cell fate regulator YaaT (PSP1 superfamily)
MVVRLKKFNRICPIAGYDSEKIKLGVPVVVKTDRGMELGVIELHEKGIPKNVSSDVKLKKVLRYATDEDLAKAASVEAKEKELLALAKKKSKEFELKIKVFEAEILFEENHSWVYYAEEDEKKHSQTRDLARELGTTFGFKVELKQLNHREAARLIGGLGHCGLTLCCQQWLDRPKHVTVKMVKEQGLPVNPSKTSGQCGRLMCCLSYEYEQKPGGEGAKK